MRLRAALSAAGAALVLASGCGSQAEKTAAPAPTPASRAASAAAETTVRAADCAVWEVLGPRDRTHLLVALRKLFGAAVSGTPEQGQILPDATATRLLDRSCHPSFASHFKIYKLYGRAAAFTSP